MKTLTLETGSFIFEAVENVDFLTTKLRRFQKDFRNFPVFVVLLNARQQKLYQEARKEFRDFDFISIDHWNDLLEMIKTEFVIFSPAGAPYSPFLFENVILSQNSITPWVPLLDLPKAEGARMSLGEVGWMGPVSLFKTSIGIEKSLTLQKMEIFLENSSLNIQYQSSAAGSLKLSGHEIKSGLSPISKMSSVLAIVPHFNCNAYLEQCLRSLTAQSRPLDGIVVVDDGSRILPVEIVENFKNVTLLKSSWNGGLYQIIQRVIETSAYDAYLFQDADDWSSLDRLEILLTEAEKTGAELIGTQELLFFGDTINAQRYPLDVAGALAKGPSYALLHPSSLVSRDLVMRIGGYATGLKFSGDLEFLNRAVHAARIENADVFAYFRRMRQGSLTLSPETGLGSAARVELHDRIRARAWENLKKISEGLLPQLTPLEQAEPISLEWIAGPRLRQMS